MKGDGGRCEGRNDSPLLQGEFLPPKAPLSTSKQTAAVQKSLSLPGRRKPPCNNGSSELQVSPQWLR